MGKYLNQQWPAHIDKDEKADAAQGKQVGRLDPTCFFGLVEILYESTNEGTDSKSKNEVCHKVIAQ